MSLALCSCGDCCLRCCGCVDGVPAHRSRARRVAHPSLRSIARRRCDPERIIVPTNQVLSPLGRQVAYGGRPVDLALSPDGRWLAVLDRAAVLTDRSRSRQDRRPRAAQGRQLRRAGLHARRQAAAGLEHRRHDRRVRGRSRRRAGSRRADQAGRPGRRRSRRHPAGRPGDRSRPARRCGPCSTCATRWPKSTWPPASVSARSRSATRPTACVLLGGKAYVSNWGGRLPDARARPRARPGAARRSASIRMRHIAYDGSVSVVDLEAGKEQKQIVVGLHPSAMVATPDGRLRAAWPMPTATRSR